MIKNENIIKSGVVKNAVFFYWKMKFFCISFLLLDKSGVLHL